MTSSVRRWHATLRPASHRPGQSPLSLLDDLGRGRSVPVPRHIDPDLAGALGRHRLGSAAIADIPRARDWPTLFFMAQVPAHLLAQVRSQARLGKLHQQPVGARQGQALPSGPADQLLRFCQGFRPPSSCPLGSHSSRHLPAEPHGSAIRAGNTVRSTVPRWTI
jgi:hypothetical protein